MLGTDTTLVRCFMRRYARVRICARKSSTASTHPAVQIPVLYLDSGVLVINKPHGFKCQYYRGDEDDPTTSLMSEVQELYKLPHLPFGIHRLDKATTGALIWGLTSHYASRISKQFQARTVKKTYLAIVHGGADCFPQRDGVIEGAMMRLTRGEVTMQSSPAELIRKKSHVRSEWEVLASSPVAPLSLVSVRPYTGFMHQIRVHMAEGLNAPILGDAKYARTHPAESDPAITSMAHIQGELMYLHAAELTFLRFRPTSLQTHTAVTVCAPLPATFVRLCKDLELPLPDQYVNGGLYIDGVHVQGSHPVLEDLNGRWMPKPAHISLASTLPTDTPQPTRQMVTLDATAPENS